MKRTLAWVLLTLFACGGMVSAGAAEERMTLLVIGRTAGQGGTFFTSDVVLKNTADAPRVTEMQYQDFSGAPPVARSVTLAPGEHRIIADALRTLFDRESGLGVVLTRIDEDVVVHARTANVTDPVRTFGFLSELPERSLVGDGRVGHVAVLRERGRTRTNVGWWVEGALDVDAELVLFDTSGVELGRLHIPGDLPLMGQRPLGTLAGGEAAHIELRMHRGVGTAYAVSINGGTGDSVLSAASVTPQVAADLLVNGSYTGSGANGGQWVADLTLLNPGDAAASVRIDALNAAGAPSHTALVPPRGALTIEDILGNPLSFALPRGTYTALRIRADTPLLAFQLAVDAMPGSSAATYGLQRAVPVAELLAPERDGIIIGLRNDPSAVPGFRTGLRFTAGSVGATFTAVCDDASETRIGIVEGVRLAPFAVMSRGLADFFPRARLSPVSVRVIVAEGSLAAEASVIDNGSNDAMIVAAVPLPHPCAGMQAPELSAASTDPSCPRMPTRIEARGVGYESYRYFLDGILIATAGDTLTVPATSGAYTAVGVRANGCVSPVSAPVRLALRATPTASLRGSTTIAPGESAILRLTMSGTPPFRIRWSDGHEETVQGTSSTRTVSPSVTTMYSITHLQDASGCYGTVNGRMVITVRPGPCGNVPKPTVFLSGPVPFPPGGYVTLTSSLGSSYLWSNGATTRSITVPAGGSYFVTTTDMDGCTRTSNVVIAYPPVP